MRRALYIFDRVIDIGALLAALLLLAVMLATTIKIVFRYWLHHSIIGVDQISGSMLVYIAFLGAAWVLRRDEHVTVDLLLAHVGPRARRWLLVASSLIAAAVCIVVAVFGASEVITSYQRGVRIPAEIEMPRAVNLVVIPIGFLFMGLQFLRRAADIGRGGEPSLPPPTSAV